jgi:hypothetical protein
MSRWVCIDLEDRGYSLLAFSGLQVLLLALLTLCLFLRLGGVGFNPNTTYLGFGLNATWLYRYAWSI